MTYHNRFRVLFDVTQSSECEININTEGGISNNGGTAWIWWNCVVICLKIRTFVVSATTVCHQVPVLDLLWFAWKFVPLWYQQQQITGAASSYARCDLLENSYLCGISNNPQVAFEIFKVVVICLKIRTFVVSATTLSNNSHLKHMLWFAWKFVPLWYQQQHGNTGVSRLRGCDLLENSYLCGISNNYPFRKYHIKTVVICLKIRTFVVSATTYGLDTIEGFMLWFAWKFVPLWYQQQPSKRKGDTRYCCDLLENSYLCGISNNYKTVETLRFIVVICLKIRTFVVSATTAERQERAGLRCDLLENSYLCGISNNLRQCANLFYLVVICLKIRTFVVSATTDYRVHPFALLLWFAWKFVPLWYQQQHTNDIPMTRSSCDLLENSYLCGISNNFAGQVTHFVFVVICLKIRTFVVSATTGRIDTLLLLSCDLLENSYLCGISNNPYILLNLRRIVVICLKIRTFVVSATTKQDYYLHTVLLWFAWKFVPLWYQQQPAVSEWIDKRSCDLLENSYLCGISNNHKAI